MQFQQYVTVCHGEPWFIYILLGQRIEYKYVILEEQVRCLCRRAGASGAYFAGWLLEVLPADLVPFAFCRS